MGLGYNGKPDGKPVAGTALQTGSVPLEPD